MTFEGTYIGYGIKIDILELANIIKSEKANSDIIENYGFNSYMSTSDIYESLVDYINEYKVFGLDLCILQKPHGNINNVYFGDFVLVSGSDFGSIMFDNAEQLKQVLTNSLFKNICLDCFKKEPKLLSISLGCFCCT